MIGAIAGEVIGGKEIVKAGRAGWGTFLGSLAGVDRKAIYRADHDRDLSDERAVAAVSRRQKVLVSFALCVTK